ncbi:MAG: hypothetical protein GY786_04545 [Proteobacteria bacterium]|nr:hypothetical protein [Pseudomonadota bacterium]
MQNSHKTWAERMTQWGYVTLLINRAVSREDKRGIGTDIVTGAYGAYDHLLNLRHVDKDRIGLIGWSIGGTKTFSLISSNSTVREKTKPIKAAIAIYPGCNTQGDRFTAPC